MKPRRPGHHGAEWRPAVLVGLFGSSAILLFLVFSGAIFALTNGSEIGLFLTIGMVFVAGLLDFAGIMVVVRGIQRRSRHAATIHQWRPRPELADRTHEDVV